MNQQLRLKEQNLKLENQIKMKLVELIDFGSKILDIIKLLVS